MKFCDPEDELPRLVLCIHDALDVRKQIRATLDLIENHSPAELVEKSAWIVLRKLTNVRTFKRRISVIFKNPSNQRRLA